MKYRLLLFALLLLIMAGLPFLALPARQNALLENSVQQNGASLENAASSSSDAKTSEKRSFQSAVSSVPPETAALPVSKVSSMSEPILLLDKATGQVIKMAQDEYVLGAVCSEMPPKFHPEALKAQAVAAHSYILRCKEQQEQNPDPALKGAYLEIDTGSRSGYVSEAVAREQYGERFDLYYPAVKEAVAQVENQILVYNGEPIVAAYHAISAGKTENAQNVWTGSADYLVPVDSPGDRLAPDYESKETFSVDEVQERLISYNPNLTLSQDPSQWFSDLTRSESGYITSLQIDETEIPGQTLRTLFNQRSSNLEIAFQNNSFHFTATGYGHGVGMSQYGADYMARQGSSYQEILAHYYTGSRLVQLQEKL